MRDSLCFQILISYHKSSFVKKCFMDRFFFYFLVFLFVGLVSCLFAAACLLLEEASNASVQTSKGTQEARL